MSSFEKIKQFSNKSDLTESSTIEIADSNVQAICEEFVLASRNYKKAEASLKSSQEAILNYIKPIHSTNIKENKHPPTTYRINNSLICIFTDRFSALKEADIELTKENLFKIGVPFDRLFKERVKLKLKESVSENENEISNLITQLGDLLPKFFDVSVETVPVENFDKVVAQEGTYDQVSNVLKHSRYKPTLKVS
jgi:hypothetical protein